MTTQAVEYTVQLCQLNLWSKSKRSKLTGDLTIHFSRCTLTSLTCGLKSSWSNGRVASEYSCGARTRVRRTFKANHNPPHIPHPHKLCIAPPRTCNPLPWQTKYSTTLSRLTPVSHWTPAYPSTVTYHLPDVGGQAVPKILCGFDGELGRKVIDRAH